VRHVLLTQKYHYHYHNKVKTFIFQLADDTVLFLALVTKLPFHVFNLQILSVENLHTISTLFVNILHANICRQHAKNLQQNADFAICKIKIMMTSVIVKH